MCLETASAFSKGHTDVQALTAAAFLETTDGGIRADYPAIETAIAV
jgi:hypothetical protein